MFSNVDGEQAAYLENLILGAAALWTLLVGWTAYPKSLKATKILRRLNFGILAAAFA